MVCVMVLTSELNFRRIPQENSTRWIVDHIRRNDCYVTQITGAEGCSASNDVSGNIRSHTCFLMIHHNTWMAVIDVDQLIR